jgi:hypothetical protein
MTVEVTGELLDCQESSLSSTRQMTRLLERGALRKRRRHNRRSLPSPEPVLSLLSGGLRLLLRGMRLRLQEYATRERLLLL